MLIIVFGAIICAFACACAGEYIGGAKERRFHRVHARPLSRPAWRDCRDGPRQTADVPLVWNANQRASNGVSAMPQEVWPNHEQRNPSTRREAGKKIVHSPQAIPISSHVPTAAIRFPDSLPPARHAEGR